MGQKGSRLLNAGHGMDWAAATGQRPTETTAASGGGYVWPSEETTVGDWAILETLGVGAFGRVVLAQRGSGELAAIKMLPRGPRVRQYKTYVAREILHHASLRHPFIISLNEVVLTPRSLAIVMEYAAGGDMFSHLRDRRVGCRLIEAEARWMFQQLSIGLAYCHDRGVANRDLKLENLLLDRATSGIDGDWPLLKICDFGYSKHELNSTAKTGVGTPLYMAPEVISGAAKYDAKRADIWSCGVILFTILFGQYPFKEDKDFARRIVAGQWTMPQAEAEGLSPECRDMLSRLLVVNPEKRIGMEGIFAHPWFQRDLPEGALAMNTSYMQSAPNLDQCVPLVGQLIEAATIEGSPTDASLSLKLDGSLPAGLVVAPPPRLSFGARHGLTFEHCSLHAVWLILVLLAVSLVRVPHEHAQLRFTLRLYIATFLCELAWRRTCRSAPHGGSYMHWRHLLVPLYAALDILLSRYGIVRAGLDTTEPPAQGARGAAHLAMLLLLSSRSSSNLVAWSLCHRFLYVMPAQLAIVYSHWRANAETCAAAVLSAPTAVAKMHSAAQLLTSVQLGGFTAPLISRPLTPREECRTLLAWQQLCFSLAAPALVAAAIETRLWLRHQEERRQCGLPPEGGWQAWCYRALQAVLLGHDWAHVVVLSWLLAGLLHLMAVALSVDA
ncbi:Serine threonine- kinase SAPK1 [Chlorella sorokiniana]|uniref:Serine threonine-kinase SAPK1 n=1 Tax=Chlorella sorokiniana TaxID=3076 RepID=A0A2P6TGG0_CHLSO|nr:Serine threonine- kinase SAPK1 [Chlorella sorokiniana]|eukprot:PRW33203.1 Serine threonine- kinase SAPK1 [Chlorella sorokiniana]